MTSTSVPLGQLGLALIKIGAFAFGGVGSTLALLRSELGARRGWITDADVAEALAIVQTLPGSPGVLVVGFLGWRLGGWPAALLAPFCFVAVPAALMAAASAAIVALPETAAVRGALLGIQVVIVGILAANMVKMARSSAQGPRLAAVLVAGLVLGALVSAAAAVVALGVLGALIAVRPPKDARHG